jgi:hypothetical protein
MIAQQSFNAATEGSYRGTGCKDWRYRQASQFTTDYSGYSIANVKGSRN